MGWNWEGEIRAWVGLQGEGGLPSREARNQRPYSRVWGPRNLYGPQLSKGSKSRPRWGLPCRLGQGDMGPGVLA